MSTSYRHALSAHQLTINHKASTKAVEHAAKLSWLQK